MVDARTSLSCTPTIRSVHYRRAGPGTTGVADYDYDDDVDPAPDITRRKTATPPRTRPCPVTASVPLRHALPGSSAMRVRRRRIFVTLLVLCMVVTALDVRVQVPDARERRFVAWAALLGFVVLALVSLGLGSWALRVPLRRTKNSRRTSRWWRLALRDVVVRRRSMKMADEREWRRETGLDAALG